MQPLFDPICSYELDHFRRNLNIGELGSHTNSGHQEKQQVILINFGYCNSNEEFSHNFGRNMFVQKTCREH